MPTKQKKEEPVVIDEEEEPIVIEEKEEEEKNDDDKLYDDLDDILKYPPILKQIKLEVDGFIKTLKEFKLNIKKMEKSYIHDMNYLNKRKRHRKMNGKPTGFNKPRLIPDKMAELIKIPKGTQMSGPQYTKKFYDYIKENKLHKNDTLKIFRINKEIQNAFDLTNEQVKIMNESTNDRDPNGFNFTTIQRFFSKEFNKVIV